jgi:drug/metabolite transporter (DMT)-like permease
MGGVTDTRAKETQSSRARVRGAATAGWAALLIVWVVWGSTYLGIRVGVEAIPPLLMSGVRYALAGVILFPLALRGGDRATRAADRPTPGGWIACAIPGILLLAAGNGGLSLGERTVDSGLAALLVASVPLWLLVIDAVLNRARVGPLPLAGLLAGLAGVALLAGVGHGPARSGGAGVAVILTASFSWALGTILYARLAGGGVRAGRLTIAAPARPLLATAMQMLAGAVVLLAAAAASGEFADFHPAAVPLRCWLALAYLAGPGSILALSAYGIAVRSLPTPTVATYAYVNPVVAVILGTLLLSEPVSPAMMAGGGLIVAAVATVVAARPAAPH